MLPPQPDDRQYQYSVSGGRANEEERELVKMIAKVMPNTIPYGKCLAISEVIIPVVKANLGKIAKVCFHCSGEGTEAYRMMSEVHYRECPMCKGIGITPKGKQ